MKIHKIKYAQWNTDAKRIFQKKIRIKTHISNVELVEKSRKRKGEKDASNAHKGKHNKKVKKEHIKWDTERERKRGEMLKRWSIAIKCNFLKHHYV